MLERLLHKLLDAVANGWCPVCNAGNFVNPANDIIECWNCGVAVHYYNWLTGPQSK